MLFPTSVRNGGSPEVRAGEQIATATNYFTGRPGTESLWLIWTRGNVPELENARKNAMETGTVSDRKTAESLRTYLASYPVRRLSVSSSGDFATRLQTDGDAIVHRVELAHK
jgi:hypothetical protein